MLSERAPGKVNLCLLVGAPRAEDGLHPLVSIVQPVDLADELTFAPAHSGDTATRSSLTARRPADTVICPGVTGENLAARALAEFRRRTGWDAPPRTLMIHKRLPIAAGMGGGSSDAAAALRLAAADSGIPIPDELPMQLGADVPVLLRPARSLMTGAGEYVELLGGDKPPLVVLPLDATLSTAAVYRAFDDFGTPRSAAELIAAAARIRGGELAYVNDLEPVARRLCPAIDPALEALHRAGVEHPMVTGSGPTVFGITDDPDAVARLHAAGYPRAAAA